MLTGFMPLACFYTSREKSRKPDVFYCFEGGIERGTKRVKWLRYGVFVRGIFKTKSDVCNEAYLRK